MNDPWTRQRLKKIFISLFPDPHHSPRYQKVKKKDPFLYDMIMHRFNGYRAFLKAIKRPMPPTSAKERAFIKYSSNVSKRYYINCWSTLEEYTFAALVLLNEENNFIHNCPFPSKISKDYITQLTLLYLRSCSERNDSCPQVKQIEDITRNTLKSGRRLSIVGGQSIRINTENSSINGDSRIKKSLNSTNENITPRIREKFFRNNKKMKEDLKGKCVLNLSRLSAANVQYVGRQIQEFLSSIIDLDVKRENHGLKFINYHRKNYCPLFNFCARIATLLSTLLKSKSRGSFYHLDFFDFDRMLLIEVDGIFHTAIPGQKERDAERDRYIGSFGIRILRLNSNNFKDLSHLPHIINLFIHPEKYHV
jgi:very-short-patch-repair endonuclease